MAFLVHVPQECERSFMEKQPVNIMISDISLNSVRFELGQFDKTQAYDVPVVDEVRVADVTSDSFALVFDRKTTNTIPFSFSATFSATIHVSNLSELDNNGETIEEYAERVKEKIAEQAGFPSRASLILSDVTRETGCAFITPPVLLTAKK